MCIYTHGADPRKHPYEDNTMTMTWAQAQSLHIIALRAVSMEYLYTVILRKYPTTYVHVVSRLHRIITERVVVSRYRLWNVECGMPVASVAKETATSLSYITVMC